MKIVYNFSEREDISEEENGKLYQRDFNIFDTEKSIYLSSWEAVYTPDEEEQILENISTKAQLEINRLNAIKECLILKKLNLKYFDQAISEEVDNFLKQEGINLKNIDDVREEWLVVNMVKHIDNFHSFRKN